MSTSEQIITASGIQNAPSLVAAATAAGLPLWIAVALAEKESRGANIYGHDAGGTYYGAGAVTAANYATFYDLVINHGNQSNGVGPLQITYKPYFTQAKAQGLKLWVPKDNFLFGFRILAKNLAGVYTKAQIEKAGTLYNEGNLNSGITAYGRDLAIKASTWKARLAAATKPPVVKPPAKPPVVAPAVLKVGSAGTAVKSLQAGLNRVFPTYSKLVVDGKFGPATQKVVAEFQRRVGIKADGIVNAATRAKLKGFKIVF